VNEHPEKEKRTAGAPPLTFGIYPGNSTGITAGVPDDPARIQDALNQLQASGRPFLVRGYIPYQGSSANTNSDVAQTPANVEQYSRHGRKLDLVLQFRVPDLEGWINFIRETVKRYGPFLAKLQITEEPNATNLPLLDGTIPGVREAIVQGIFAAKDEVQRQGYDIQVGFNAAFSPHPNDDFWPSIGKLGGPSFVEALDCVGLDFFPDVFRPLAPDGEPGDVRSSVVAVLNHYRNVSMAAAGIPASVPLHINENGWPTGPTRTYERQATVIETIIQTIYEQRERFNITHYEHFDLRDADSANPDLFSQFGLLRDDYSPKPAFETYRRLIATLGV
jgi:hypothetical protein